MRVTACPEELIKQSLNVFSHPPPALAQGSNIPIRSSLSTSRELPAWCGKLGVPKLIAEVEAIQCGVRRENQWLALAKLWFFSLAASPAVKLFVKPATERNGEEEHVICKVDGFYPEAIDIRWEESTLNDPHFRAITEGIITSPTVKNDDGTFSVTSSLVLKPALKDHGNTFTCVVSHRSLLDSKRLSVTLPGKSKHPPAPPLQDM